MINKLIKIASLSFLIPITVFANTQFFEEGINLFKNKKFDEAKLKFEQDIVFNPKSEMAYLYLSKIFNNLKKKDLEEQNLNTVILLNPKNEEALYNLARLKLNNSDYKKVKSLMIDWQIFAINSVIKVLNLKLKLKIYQKNKCNFI